MSLFKKKPISELEREALESRSRRAESEKRSRLQSEIRENRRAETVSRIKSSRAYGALPSRETTRKVAGTVGTGFETIGRGFADYAEWQSKNQQRANIKTIIHKYKGKGKKVRIKVKKSKPRRSGIARSFNVWDY